MPASASWSNWARTQHCDPVAIERPKSRREVAQAIERAAERGPDRPGGGLRALVQRRACRPTARCSAARPAEPDPRRRRGVGPRARRGRDHARRAQPRAPGARPGAPQPRRHRRADAGRRAGHRDARHRRGAAEPLRAGRGDRSSCSATARTGRSPAATCCAPRASASARWASSRRSRCAACPRSGCAAWTARSRWRTCSTRSTSAPTRHDHFEFWTFPHSPLALTRTNDRTDAPVDTPGPRPPRGCTTSCSTTTRCWGSCSPAARFPRAIPAINRLASRAASRPRARRLVAPHLRQPAARALRRDGVRDPARARRRRRARLPRDPRAPPGLVPDRAALRGRRRRAALARPRRATPRTSPCTCSRGWTARRRSARSRS